ALPSDGNNRFVVSSLFPFIQMGQVNNFNYFFPKPATGISITSELFDHLKKIKNIAWIDSTYFSKILRGESLGRLGGENCEHIKGEFLSKDFTLDEIETKVNSLVIESQVIQRVSLPRKRDSTNENNLFSMERLYFKENTGL